MLTLLAGISACKEEAKTHSFAIKDGNFLYDGKPVSIYSGEMHYSRIPHEYWEHRLQMIKALGLNTVATYIFWNHHEVSPGVWDLSLIHISEPTRPTRASRMPSSA